MSKFLLAKRWNTLLNPKGYIVSEKLDGYRAIWDGTNFITRNDNVIPCPAWFTKGFPNEALDGEIWAGRGERDIVASAVKGSREADWKRVIYAVFDAPDYPGPFEKRIIRAKKIIKEARSAIVIPFWKCQSKSQLLSELNKIIKGGGEGLMLRKPGSLYERKRSDVLLKVKKWVDDEAIIIGHIEGTRPGLCGSLQVIAKNGKIFKVASGMTEAMASNPPPIGTIITYKYESLSKDGIPNPATFLNIKDD